MFSELKRVKGKGVSALEAFENILSKHWNIWNIEAI